PSPDGAIRSGGANLPARLGLTARQNDIGANREPKRIVAYNRDAGENSNNCNDDESQRKDKHKVHTHFLLVGDHAIDYGPGPTWVSCYKCAQIPSSTSFW